MTMWAADLVRAHAVDAAIGCVAIVLMYGAVRLAKTYKLQVRPYPLHGGHAVALCIEPRSRPQPPAVPTSKSGVFTNADVGLGLGSMLSPRLTERIMTFVRDKMALAKDSSHDWSHVQRVWRLARLMAIEEGVQDSTVIELAALSTISTIGS